MILGLGALAVDDLLGIDSFPVPGEKMRVLWRRREGGGLAATALATAAKLGARTEWLGTLGDDELSQWARADLMHHGVGMRLAQSSVDARPHASVILVEPDGRRTVLSSNAGVLPFPVEAITAGLLQDVQAVFVDHTQVAAACALAALAQQHGVPVVCDLERHADGPEALLPHVDHFISGLAFAQQLTDEATPAAMLQALRGRFRTGASCCALTDGERGCWFWAGDAAQHIPAFVVQVVDTTGCGDAFHGAYLAQITRGETVEAALRFAAATAALVAGRIGGRSKLPTRDEVEELLGRSVQ